MPPSFHTLLRQCQPPLCIEMPSPNNSYRNVAFVKFTYSDKAVSRDLACKLSGNRTGCYVLYELRLNAHRFGNPHEVFCWHPEMTEAKDCTPTGLVLDEGKRLNQRLDWCLFRLEKIHVDPIGLEVFGQLHTIHLTAIHGADCGEAL